jgi:hypothetical protein
LGEPARRALADHRRGIVVKGREQRGNRVVGANVRQALDGAVAHVLVGVMDRRKQNVDDAFRFDAAIREQAQIPQHIGSRPWSPVRAAGSSRSTVAAAFSRFLAAMSTSTPAARTRKSSELMAVMNKLLNRSLRTILPRQSATRRAICSLAPR